MVIRAGEDILARIDNDAIKVLREHRLIWSSWGVDDSLREDEFAWHEKDVGIRALTIKKDTTLRLFFLSLAWRSAVSKRPQFADVALDRIIVDDLKKRVANENPGAIEDYPIQLFQLSTRGPGHNRTPILESLPLPADDGEEPQVHPVMRLYFDGLVAYVHLPNGRLPPKGLIESSIGGGIDGKTLVVSRPFGDSRELADIQVMVNLVESQLHQKRQEEMPNSFHV